MQICRERYLISKSYKPYPSKSDPTKTPYRAYAFRIGSSSGSCTCFPFLTGRKKKAAAEGTEIVNTEFSCSHLKKLYKTTCDWIQETEDDYQWNQCCPKCGEEVVNTDVIDIPDDRDGQIEDLRNLLKTLQAGEPDEDLEPGSEADPNAGASKLLGMMKGTP